MFGAAYLRHSKASNPSGNTYYWRLIGAMKGEHGMRRYTPKEISELIELCIINNYTIDMVKAAILDREIKDRDGFLRNICLVFLAYRGDVGMLLYYVSCAATDGKYLMPEPEEKKRLEDEFLGRVKPTVLKYFDDLPDGEKKEVFRGHLTRYKLL